MTNISFEAGRKLLNTPRFAIGDLDRAIAEAKQNLGRFENKDGPGAKRYADAVQTLERMRPTPGRLSDADRTRIAGAVKNVGDATLFAQRENLPKERYVRNAGDDAGIYRHPDDGEIVRRDPGAQTREDKTKTIQNRDEPGINRDPGSGRIVSREPGAKTEVERADEKETYATSGKKVYRKGATADQVDAGRTVREGDSGESVVRMQKLLKAAGYDPGGADGYFGPKTAAAVKKFFEEQKIAQSDVGQPELARLEQLAKERAKKPQVKA